MKYFANYFIVVGVVMATATAAFPAPLALSALDNIKGTVVVPAKPIEKAAAAQPPAEKSAGKKSQVKVRHKSRRAARHAYGAGGQKAEPAAGERLSIKQVMVLLKTTRNFAGKNLSGLKLVAFDLTKCNLKGADLSNSNLERADLGESNLELADLSGANMKMTDLRLTGLKGVKLERTNLDGSIWQDGTVCAKGSTGSCRERSDQFSSN